MKKFNRALTRLAQKAKSLMQKEYRGVIHKLRVRFKFQLINDSNNTEKQCFVISTERSMRCAEHGRSE